MRHLCYNRVSICTVFLNAQVEPVAFSSFIGTGDYSCPAMFSLKAKQRSSFYSACKKPCRSETSLKHYLRDLSKSKGVCKFWPQSCQTGRARQGVQQRERERPTQNSPQEFLTIQCSVPSSATPQPTTDTM